MHAINQSQPRFFTSYYYPLESELRIRTRPMETQVHKARDPGVVNELMPSILHMGYVYSGLVANVGEVIRAKIGWQAASLVSAPPAALGPHPVTAEAAPR